MKYLNMYLTDYWKMDSEEYKKYHESFMHNNKGSSMVHSSSFILFTLMCTILCCIIKKERFKRGLVIEFIFIVLPMIPAHTVLANYIYHLNAVAIAIVAFWTWTRRRKLEITRKLNEKNTFKTNRILCISCLRGLTYLITAFCILAVDFRIFPRYLAKTETYGYSLMDTGVGLFLINSGVVHKDYRGNTKMFIKDNVKFIKILVVLGVARYFSLKQLDYQEHITEYGIHWNFFFTIAVAKAFSSVLLYFCNYSLFLSISVLVFHEFLLVTRLEPWVMGGVPRDTLLDANREGLSSCLGYVALYLFGVNAKRFMRDSTELRKKNLLRLLLWSICLWTVTYLIKIFRPASRTLANGSYCIYVESIFVTCLSILYFFEAICKDNEKDSFQFPLMLLIINDSGLLYFLTANLFTGAINVFFRTMLLKKYVALTIMNVYMVTTTTVAVYLEKNLIKL